MLQYLHVDFEQQRRILNKTKTKSVKIKNESFEL